MITGIGMAGVGMNIMHDGNHGVFSSKKWVNKLMGSSIYILAGNAYNWQIQHNVLHHTYTNIHGHDEDLDAGRILRFSEHSKWKPHHRFQHFYSFLLYGLMTINWAILTDYFQTRRYIKRNKFTKIGWNEAYAILKSKLANTSSNKIGCFTGDLTNMETAYAAKVLFNKVFKSNLIESRSENYYVNFTEKQNYRFNSNISGIEDSDLIFMIGCNPRYEATILNSRIRISNKRKTSLFFVSYFKLKFNYI